MSKRINIPKKNDSKKQDKDKNRDFLAAGLAKFSFGVGDPNKHTDFPVYEPERHGFGDSNSDSIDDTFTGKNIPRLDEFN